MILPASAPVPHILQFRTQPGPSGLTRLTLREYYQAILLPDLDLAPATLTEHRTALAHWEQGTGNPCLSDVTTTDLEQLTAYLQARGLKPATINKVWRHLKGLFSEACQDGFLEDVPSLGRKERKRRKGARVGRSQLVPEGLKQQRDLVTDQELATMFANCSKATYPSRGQFPAPLKWRVFLILLATYGQRTEDLLALQRSDIHWSRGLIRFTAQKTGKLQGLPITPLTEKALRAIWGHAEGLFSDFRSKGGCKHGVWQPGYYTTWRRDLGGDALGILMKHFRQRMVTTWNTLEPGLGGWIAGHSVQGVTARHYDQPTQRIIDLMRSAPVPACFQAWGGD